MNFSTVKQKKYQGHACTHYAKIKNSGAIWKNLCRTFLRITHCEKFRVWGYVMKNKQLKWKTKGAAQVFAVSLFIVPTTKTKMLLTNACFYVMLYLPIKRRLTKWKLRSNHEQNSCRIMFINVSVIFCTHKADIPILLDARWQWEQDTSRDKQDYTKENCLIYVLELLNSNGLEDITD